MASSFKINRQEIRKMQAAMQKEFDRAGPIRVPVEVDDTGVCYELVGRGNVTNYYGPVIHGDASGSQLSWGNMISTQTQSNATEQIAPGYETLAETVTHVLRNLPAAGLAQDDAEDATSSAAEVLEEVTQPEPDRGRLRRSLAALRGYLAPVAAGVSAGAAEGAQEWARAAVEGLQLG